jgi:hypothetical protein
MVHVSLSHPGKYQYGRRDSGGLRNFYLQTQIVYLVAYCTMKVIDQRTDTQLWLSRCDVLTEVLRRVRETLKNLNTFCLSASDDGLDICVIDDVPIRETVQSEFAGSTSATELLRSVRNRAAIVYGNTDFEGTAVSSTRRSLLRQDPKHLKRILHVQSSGMTPSATSSLLDEHMEGETRPNEPHSFRSSGPKTFQNCI